MHFVICLVHCIVLLPRFSFFFLFALYIYTYIYIYIYICVCVCVCVCLCMKLQKSIKVGGQFRTVGSTVCAATMSNIEIGAKLGIVLALGPLTARGVPCV
jgi:hypothetical protein